METTSLVHSLKVILNFFFFSSSILGFNFLQVTEKQLRLKDAEYLDLCNLWNESQGTMDTLFNDLVSMKRQLNVVGSIFSAVRSCYRSFPYIVTDVPE
jgi:hypothetical protein